MEEEAEVVVLGCGVIGAAVAYYLTAFGHTRVTAVETCAVACAASGKAGGFLAESWGDGGPTEALHRRGFALHRTLAMELSLSSYRTVTVLEARAGTGHGRESARALGCGWLNGKVRSCGLLDSCAAQVTPLELTERLWSAAEAKGAKLIYGKVIGVRCDGNSASAVVLEDGRVLECTSVVVALGPWSVAAEEWFPGLQLNMEGLWSTSVVVEAAEKEEDAFAVFFGEEQTNGTHLEIYPRPGREGVYVCGLGGTRTLSSTEILASPPHTVSADESRVAAAVRALTAVAPSLARPLATTQACMRPCAGDSLPHIGRLQQCGPENVVIATATNCWGITWAPAVGEAVAELLLRGETTHVDIAPFHPERFSNLSTATTAGRGRHRNSDPVGEQW